MRILTIALIAAVVGGAAGAAIAYVEVKSDTSTFAAAVDDKETPATLPTDEKTSRVVVDEPHYDFGKMERGHVKSHEFLIRNAGDAPLTLKVGQTTCKCTLAGVTSDAIAPGETTHVKLEWSAKSDVGPFRQTATIHTNDPHQPDVELTIDGQIVDASGIEPSAFNFDRLSVGESKTAEVYVMAMLQDKLTVDSAEPTVSETRDKFDVKIEPVPHDKLPNKSARDGVKITVTAKPGMPIGRFNQFLTLHTNFKEGETLHVPIVGRVVGDISIHGPGMLEDEGVLLLGQVEGSKGKKARVKIMVRGKEAEHVKFTVGPVDPPEMKVTIGDPIPITDTLVHIPMEVEIPPGTRPMVRLATAQGEEAKVTLKTTHPNIPEVVLGVRFAVQR